MLFNKKNEVEFFSHELKSPQIALWLFIPNMWKPWQKLNCSLTFSRFYWIKQIWLVAGANSDVIDIVTKDAPARRIAGQGAEALGEHELVPRSPRSCCKENNQGLSLYPINQEKIRPESESLTQALHLGCNPVPRVPHLTAPRLGWSS